MLYRGMIKTTKWPQNKAEPQTNKQTKIIMNRRWEKIAQSKMSVSDQESREDWSWVWITDRQTDKFQHEYALCDMR